MTALPAWWMDTHVVSETMRLRPEPRVAGLLDSIADEGPEPCFRHLPGFAPVVG